MTRISRFKDLPIGWKLAITFVLTTATALLLATFFFTYTSWQHEKESAKNELLAVANIIGANSTAALAFGDATAAQETLATLRAVPGVLQGVLYDESGNVLANFNRQNPDNQSAKVSAWEINDNIDYQVSSPVVLENDVIGKVVLYATLAPRIQQLLDNLLTVLLASITSLAIALLVAWRMQKSITSPITRITELMQRVSRHHDYTVRSDISQQDEIGTLSDGINQMLDHVQQRDNELEQHRHELESEVSRRTAALKEANEKLKEELDKSAQTEEGLKRAHETLERHHNEFALLSEMNDRLQICHSVDEMKPVISHYTRKLFPEYGGCLYVYNKSTSLVEPLISWRMESDQVREFGHDDCWALRQGHPHLVMDPETDLICPHCAYDQVKPYICVPLIAYGEVMGILHLRLQAETTDDVMPDSFNQLSVSASERLALALANLKLKEALQEQSVRDPLTGLFNRRYMEETIERELARSKRMGSCLGIVMIDVDHFKDFNDRYGHEAGDLVLQELGNYLTRAVRTEDIACRYGGEEFVFIMPGINTENAYARAEELRKDVNNINLKYKGHVLPNISISLGVALAPADGTSTDILLDTADKALYQAKRAGRNQVVMAGNSVNTNTSATNS